MPFVDKTIEYLYDLNSGSKAKQIGYELLKQDKQNIIHRDLHSGNILYHQIDQTFRISDLGFCGPVDKPLDSIYGNLPYVAPEVIAGNGTTFASDIYSFGMLMWEVSSGQPPFINYAHDFDLAMRIINGMRPKIVPGTPLEYQELMKQCWDADPKKRPNADILIKKLIHLQNPYQNTISETNTNNTLEINETNINDTSNSRIHQFGKLPEPRNATEEQQEGTAHYIALNIDSYNFSIDDIDNSSNKSNNTSRSYNIIFSIIKKISKIFTKSKTNSSSNDKQSESPTKLSDPNEADDYKSKTIQQTKKHTSIQNEDNEGKTGIVPKIFNL
ncbi:16191_t:CDS:2 [Funneliformis geosporum]|nr:16191_t:CDS:2 [Funneliformis geosporum]